MYYEYSRTISWPIYGFISSSKPTGSKKHSNPNEKRPQLAWKRFLWPACPPRIAQYNPYVTLLGRQKRICYVLKKQLLLDKTSSWGANWSASAKKRDPYSVATHPQHNSPYSAPIREPMGGTTSWSAISLIFEHKRPIILAWVVCWPPVKFHCKEVQVSMTQQIGSVQSSELSQ